MNEIHIHNHNHPDERLLNRILEAIEESRAEMNHAISGLDTKFSEQFLLIKTKIQTIMATLADIQAANQALLAAVAREDTVIGSAVTLINGFASTLSAIQAQLAAAIAANDPAALQAVSDSLTATATDVASQSSALAAAVAANTPAA